MITPYLENLLFVTFINCLWVFQTFSAYYEPDRSISAQGGVEDWCISNCSWLMECSLNHTCYFERFSTDFLYVKIFAKLMTQITSAETHRA